MSMSRRHIYLLTMLGALGAFVLSGCGTPSDPTYFATVSYYDNNPEGASLVGIDYVIRGRATSYRPVTLSTGETVTYDYVDLSNVTPDVGAYRDFKGWNYGNYPEGSNYNVTSSSSVREVVLDGEAVDPNHVYANCSATPIFEDTYYTFGFRFRNGASTLRRTDSEGNRTPIGDSSLTVLDLANIASGDFELDYPGRNPTGYTDDVATPNPDGGYHQDFLGYGLTTTSGISGYCLPEEIGSNYYEGAGAPSGIANATVGAFYVDSEALNEEGEKNYPLYIYLDTLDGSSSWFSFGNIASTTTFTFEAIFSEPALNTYDVRIGITDMNGSTIYQSSQSCLEHFAIASVEIENYVETATNTYSLTLAINQTSIEEKVLEPILLTYSNLYFRLTEGYVLDLDFSSYSEELGQITSAVDIAVTLEETPSILTVEVVDDFSDPNNVTNFLYKISYGEPLGIDCPTLADHHFLGYSILTETGYQYFDVSRITSNVTLYPVFAENTATFNLAGTSTFFGENTSTVTTLTLINKQTSPSYSIDDFAVNGLAQGATNVTANFGVYFNNLTTIATNRSNLTLPVTHIEDAFNDIKGSEFNLTFEIPASIIGFTQYTFRMMSGLKAIHFHETTTLEIPQSAFEFCNSLNDVTFESGLTSLSIGEMAFRHCETLNWSNIDFPSGQVSIDHFAFSGCLALGEPTITSNMTYLGNYVFSDCELNNINVASGVDTSTYEPKWNHDHTTGAINITNLA